jgi:hypothetical protein
LNKGRNEKSLKTQRSHHHSEEEASQLFREGRRRSKGMPRTRDPLFFTNVREKDTALSTFGIYKLAHFTRGKIILKHIDRRSNPCAIILNGFKGGMERILLQSNNELTSTWRGGVCLSL